MIVRLLFLFSCFIVLWGCSKSPDNVEKVKDSTVLIPVAPPLQTSPPVRRDSLVGSYSFISPCKYVYSSPGNLSAYGEKMGSDTGSFIITKATAADSSNFIYFNQAFYDTYSPKVTYMFSNGTGPFVTGSVPGSDFRPQIIFKAYIGGIGPTPTIHSPLIVSLKDTADGKSIVSAFGWPWWNGGYTLGYIKITGVITRDSMLLDYQSQYKDNYYKYSSIRVARH
ncbi:MAG: hypothetical protein JWN76_1359 [Chitinophagaceae bacterium]|nr:hypothetical protein [Chitinophagaceae bacterium]